MATDIFVKDDAARCAAVAGFSSLEKLIDPRLASVMDSTAKRPAFVCACHVIEQSLSAFDRLVVRKAH